MINTLEIKFNAKRFSIFVEFSVQLIRFVFDERYKK